MTLTQKMAGYVRVAVETAFGGYLYGTCAGLLSGTAR